MIVISHSQFFRYLEPNGGEPAEGTWEEFARSFDDDEDGVPVDSATFYALRECDFKCVLAGREMSENHLGGDELVAMADDVSMACEQGYRIETWYGPNTEALVVGYREGEIKFQDVP